MSKIILSDINELEEKYLKAIEILIKLRKYKKKWDAEYGAANRNTLRRWEDNADAYLASLTISGPEPLISVKVQNSEE